mmetsp:Transcript_1083/g.2635  ORF Transcript_1083/g.2635 Transcript_1083/m.2635 type:complete len:325 (-) Transcript_1083:72-1046(-)
MLVLDQRPPPKRVCVFKTVRGKIHSSALDDDLAVLAALEAREVGLRVVADGPVARRLKLEGVAAALDARPAHLAPVLAPRVAHLPVLHAVLVHTPAHDGDLVVDHVDERLHVVGENTAGVVEERDRVDAAADRATGHDLVHHLLLTRHGAVLGDGGVRVLLDGGARHAEGRAGHADAARVRGRVELVLAVHGLVRHAGVEGDAEALIGPLLHQRVRASRVAALARARGERALVEDDLDGQVDLRSLLASGAARDLDAIGERRHGAVSPARAAVGRDVLVEHLGDKALALPREGVRKVLDRSLEVLHGRHDVLARQVSRQASLLP